MNTFHNDTLGSMAVSVRTLCVRLCGGGGDDSPSYSCDI